MQLAMDGSAPSYALREIEDRDYYMTIYQTSVRRTDLSHGLLVEAKGKGIRSGLVYVEGRMDVSKLIISSEWVTDCLRGPN